MTGLHLKYDIHRMGHEKVARFPFAFAFGYCINFCIYAVLRNRVTFSWHILYKKTGNVRQRRRNVTLRRVRATIVAVGKQLLLHNLSMCICNFKYPACNAHAPYCHLWPAPVYTIFPHYLINGTIFENKLLNKKVCVLFFYISFVWDISHSKEKWARYDKKAYRSSCKVPFVLVRFEWNLNFLNRFSKNPQISISWQ
jgi:hypothetical protein